MSVLRTINDFLRDRKALYEMAREGKNLRSICGRLLLIFVLTTGIYGAVMGAFRCIHPSYYFSDFDLSAPGQSHVQGKVAGMSAENRAVYTRARNLPATSGATIRFNLSEPSEAYDVAVIGEEKGYGKIVLAPGSVLEEPGSWKLPLIVALKIPLLFILTLLVCALALYAMNMSFGLQLHFMPTMTVMLFALAGTGVALVVFAPISLLFTVVTASYHFMKILHVLVFIVAGSFGLKILGEALPSMRSQQAEADKSAATRGRAARLRLAWLLLYCLVGAQLAWTLKPFLGTPYLPATPPFRIEKGNIFVSTLESFRAVRER